MSPSNSSGLLFPKPNYKAQRRKRKNRIKYLDQKLSRETESFICQNCGTWGKTDPAHIISRRFQKSRHDPKNIKRKCRKCHDNEPKEMPHKTYNVFP